MPKNATPIVWTIAGSDSSAGAGIQANLKTMQGLGVYCCTAITALTAQNTQGVFRVEPVSPEMLKHQLEALRSDLPPTSLNLGMLHSTAQMHEISKQLRTLKSTVVCDPVIRSTSGHRLIQADAIDGLKSIIFPLSDLITPNIHEALLLLGLENEVNVDDLAEDDDTDTLIESLALRLLQYGPRFVLLKGGHRNGRFSQDFLTDGINRYWLTSARVHSKDTHGTGCTLSAAVTACLALGRSMVDSVVIAKSYVNQGMRLAPRIGHGYGPLGHVGWPETETDIPWLSRMASAGRDRVAFPKDYCLNFYPIVDRTSWLKRLLPLGIKTVQLRIKDLTGSRLEDEIQEAIDIARKYDAHLYINDYWQLAIKYQAFGVHLGQEDLLSADVRQIQKNGLHLGVSTHNYEEVSRALTVQPSYIAIGPIHHTTTKQMVHAPQGVASLARWRRTLNYPLVAIGGIFLSNASEILATGVEGISVVRDICNAENPEDKCLEWLELFAARSALSALSAQLSIQPSAPLSVQLSGLLS